MREKTNGRGKKAVLSLLTALLLSGPVLAEVWTSGHYEIVDGNSYGELDIYNDVTVDIFGGTIGRLAAFD